MADPDHEHSGTPATDGDSANGDSANDDSANDTASSADPADHDSADDGSADSDSANSDPADDGLADDTADDTAEAASPADSGPGEAGPGPGAREDAVPAPSGGSVPSGGTVPPWWGWVGRHRKPVVLVAGLLVVGLVATLVAVAVFTPGPKDVVRDYLDAIRSGDTGAALAIAGEPDEAGRLEFLSADALADDWSVDAVVERHRRDADADVDVTFSAGKTSQQGRFHLVNGDDGWTIEEPFVRVDLTAGGLDVVELGGVRRSAQRDTATGAVPVLLFPGVYELYPGFAERLAFEPSVLVATPQETKDATLRFTADYTLTDAGTAAAQEAVDARIDECAAKTEIGPAGCPFDAQENRVIRRLDDLADVAWTVVTHPEAHVVARNTGELLFVVRKPGTARITGSGVPAEPAGAPRTTFALTCEFGLDNLTIDMTADGFTVRGATRDEYRAAVNTRCF
jgi:hypothetical protein